MSSVGAGNEWKDSCGCELLVFDDRCPPLDVCYLSLTWRRRLHQTPCRRLPPFAATTLLPACLFFRWWRREEDEEITEVFRVRPNEGSRTYLMPERNVPMS